MESSNEKLCVQWNGFKDNLTTSFGNLRQDKDFTDVTLASDDGDQVDAHKVVLVSSSPFFENLLRRNKHPRPLVYMRGASSEDLLAMVDFLYNGETKVFQDNLDTFLKLGNDLQLKGLQGNQCEEREIEKKISETKPSDRTTRADPWDTKTIQKKKNYSSNERAVNDFSGNTELEELNTNINTNTKLDELDQKVKSLMLKSESYAPGKSTGRFARICKVCRKEGAMNAVVDHIEANHITGISIPCGICQLVFRTRINLRVHNRKYHRD